MSCSDRLEVELEKLQNSSSSADATPFSTPCWNTTSPWDNNGTFQLMYDFCLQLCVHPAGFFLLSYRERAASCGKSNKSPKSLEICVKQLPLAAVQSHPSVFPKGLCSFCLVPSLSQFSSALLLFDSGAKINPYAVFSPRRK